MQVAVIEFARHKANLTNANSTEFEANTPHPVIALVTEWTSSQGSIEKRDHSSDLGGTMRLGGEPCHLIENTKARMVYGNESVVERHRHRYEVNNQYVSQLEKAGLIIAGRSADGQLVEMIEMPNHPWFIACQFHPEFTSTPRDGHPLFKAFIEAAKQQHKLNVKNKGHINEIV